MTGKPSLATASAATRALHEPIDANAPYLHPERRSIQRDLGSSAEGIAWQEAKAAFTLRGDGAWSELPHLYARYGTPGTAELIAALRGLEQARCAIVADCGMQAVALVADCAIAAGAHVVAMRQVYNKTRAFFEATCKRVGATLALVDDGDHAALAAALRADTRLVFAETFTNPLGRAQDVPALAALVHRAPGARLVIDSTIATPWGVRAPLLATGADVVVGSLTKALGGQDAALGGYIATNDAAFANQIMDLVAMRGGILDDDRARRVAANLPRAREAHARRCATAARVAGWLGEHPRVERVFHPSRPDHPDAAVIARDYVRTGSLLAFRVRDADEAAHRVLADRLASCGIVRYALSFDGLVTKVNHHRTVSEYFTPAETVARLGIDRLIRLGIGLEEADDLIACLAWTLEP
ncbi:MAG TPA: aminotransferase class I/II-fold pyridoxal phosphate-dependent enzyme [Kofleriaceae bacterium]|nr:aminotransferase class I/II-fold pyridoxal phosphate-dependent enzyme [Kofleriaceae bacterium]